MNFQNRDDFLGMSQLIKEQTAELERLRVENQKLRDDIAWKDRIIKACDTALNRKLVKHP